MLPLGPLGVLIKGVIASSATLLVVCPGVSSKGKNRLTIGLNGLFICYSFGSLDCERKDWFSSKSVVSMVFGVIPSISSKRLYFLWYEIHTNLQRCQGNRRRPIPSIVQGSHSLQHGEGV